MCRCCAPTPTRQPRPCRCRPTARSATPTTRDCSPRPAWSCAAPSTTGRACRSPRAGRRCSPRRAISSSGSASNPEQACPQADARCYPFGGVTYHLLGDFGTQVNWAATNTSFVERDNDTRLRGLGRSRPGGRGARPEKRSHDAGAPPNALGRAAAAAVPAPSGSPRREGDHRQHARPAPDDRRRGCSARLRPSSPGAIVQAGQTKGRAGRDERERRTAGVGELPLAADGRGRAAARRGERRLGRRGQRRPLLDRARYGVYPPGSSFKVVTAAAALRARPELARQTATCERLPDGRVGARIPGWARPVRDDPADRTPHGTIEMTRALVVSCNAYFAQLGLAARRDARWPKRRTCSTSRSDSPRRPAQLRDTLPHAAYGQGHVLVTPFKMARVAAAVAGERQRAARPVGARRLRPASRPSTAGAHASQRRAARRGRCERW